LLMPNPDKPEQITTKAPRHKAKPLVNIHLCAFVTWWREGFATKYNKIIYKVLYRDDRHLVKKMMPLKTQIGRARDHCLFGQEYIRIRYRWVPSEKPSESPHRHSVADHPG